PALSGLSGSHLQAYEVRQAVEACKWILREHRAPVDAPCVERRQDGSRARIWLVLSERVPKCPKWPVGIRWIKIRAEGCIGGPFEARGHASEIVFRKKWRVHCDTDKTVMRRAHLSEIVCRSGDSCQWSLRFHFPIRNTDSALGKLRAPMAARRHQQRTVDRLEAIRHAVDEALPSDQEVGLAHMSQP